MLLQLVRRSAGGHKMNFVEIEPAIGGARDRKMAVVNGIERSAKKRNAAWMMFCGGALRVRCGQYASPRTLTVFSHKFSKGAASPAVASAFSFAADAKSSGDSRAALGILSSASAMERTRSRTPSPATAEMA